MWQPNDFHVKIILVNSFWACAKVKKRPISVYQVLAFFVQKLSRGQFFNWNSFLTLKKVLQNHNLYAIYWMSHFDSEDLIQAKLNPHNSIHDERTKFILFHQVKQLIITIIPAWWVHIRVIIFICSARRTQLTFPSSFSYLPLIIKRKKFNRTRKENRIRHPFANATDNQNNINSRNLTIVSQTTLHVSSYQ